MYHPVATYRLQFHKEFSFEEFEKVLSYLQKLGVTTIYASPIFKAMPGSLHGYDGLNPHEINPEIGTKEKLETISKSLKEKGMGWLQDIVPNHMAFHPSNLWLADVLEKGQQSVYSNVFDITWSGQIFKGRLMVPFLGNALETVVSNGELKLNYQDGRFVFMYYDTAFPLNPRSYELILQSIDDKPSQAIQDLLQQMDQLKIIEDKTTYAKGWDEFLLQLHSLMKHKNTREFIQKCMDKINTDSEHLQALVDEQYYRLCHWQETDTKINYRRFFTVNGLICLNMQNEAVFELYHQYVKELLDEGIFQGLRIDHVDGLYDPLVYLQQLRDLTGDETYVVVEKILQANETLPTQWPVQGNTGYDFLAQLNNLFTQKANEDLFTQFYQDLVDDQRYVHEHIIEKKLMILHEHMGGELENLYKLFVESNLVEKKAFASVHREDLKNAIGELLIQCPVYRFYGNRMPLQGKEAEAVQRILNHVKRNHATLARAVHLLEEALLQKPYEGDEERNERALQFYQRCMQFSGPLMAKGVEDTLMYTYNNFIAHNEVGDSPEAFGSSIETFHQQMIERQERWPLSLNATATHDTKRGEDFRARLHVLSDLGSEWIELVEEWQQLTRNLKGEEPLDVNDEYFVYQTLVGSYPMSDQDEENYQQRLQQYLEKALREAKVFSNWTNPDNVYEQKVSGFASGLLEKDQPFWSSFFTFYKKIVDYGIINSLVQVLLKFTCPGIPDVYQGTELWDLSFVDPDNRRPVDYIKREAWLDEFDQSETENFLGELWNNRRSGGIKLWLTQKLFQLRRQQSEFFLQAQYLPIQVEGKYKEFVLAFARQHKQTLFIVAAPLHLAQLGALQGKEALDIDWEDTRIMLPHEATGEWENLFVNEKIKKERYLLTQEIFKPLPFALLKTNVVENVRNAGVLMHISSLPSPFGIGDMGREAKAFADSLHRCHQKIWQLLPLNPTEAGQGHSPYSSISSKAGNTLLISPENLVKDGFVTQQQLHQFYLLATDRVDFAAVEKNKRELFETVWQSYKSGKGNKLTSLFDDFCEQEKEWLEDFALYMVVKKLQGGKAWFQWPEALKQRETTALEKIRKEHDDELQKIRFEQFLFSKQWKELKTYCNQKNIQLLGDMPFYVSYDSVDVWTNREIFALDENGDMIAVAGTPPDAFSADGQLWGMPVFNWNVLKETNYDWWMKRLKKNIELFDLVRLDHFRAFADYWEVPANESTAKNGQWKPGPSTDFFEAVERTFGYLPFVAEDLGEINDAVFALRDAFRLPGMKVLAFAFDEAMPVSDYIPHNYTTNFIAYTGTHDNNTIRGWYKRDIDEATRNRLQHYAGKAVSEHDVHVVLGRMAYGSVARTVVLPLQDVLGLDETARMNVPSSSEENWGWRLQYGQFTPEAENLLKEWVWLYNRR